MNDGINYWLDRKYALLQQQADATTQNANTAQTVGVAQAGLDRTRATWLPKESMASIAKMGAETGLIGEQTKIVGPESRARVRSMNVDSDYTVTQDKVLTREGLKERSTLPGSLSAVMGRGYRLGGLFGE